MINLILSNSWITSDMDPGADSLGLLTELGKGALSQCSGKYRQTDLI